MSIYFQKNQEFYKKTQKILSIGTAAEFDFIQGEAGKYFPDYACSIPGDELPTHLNCPWESFSQQLCIPEKKNPPKTPADTPFLLIFYTNLQAIFKKQLITSAISVFLMDTQNGH